MLNSIFVTAPAGWVISRGFRPCGVARDDRSQVATVPVILGGTGRSRARGMSLSKISLELLLGLDGGRHLVAELGVKATLKGATVDPHPEEHEETVRESEDVHHRWVRQMRFYGTKTGTGTALILSSFGTAGANSFRLERAQPEMQYTHANTILTPSKTVQWMFVNHIPRADLRSGMCRRTLAKPKQLLRMSTCKVLVLM
jgi:hypothetical protein